MKDSSSPGDLHLLFGDVTCREELTGSVRTINLEAFVLTGEFLDQIQIVKCAGDVEEFSVKAKILLTALLNREQVEADRVIKQQIGGMLTPDLRGLFRQHGIENVEGGIEN